VNDIGHKMERTSDAVAGGIVSDPRPRPEGNAAEHDSYGWQQSVARRP